MRALPSFVRSATVMTVQKEIRGTRSNAATIMREQWRAFRFSPSLVVFPSIFRKRASAFLRSFPAIFVRFGV